MLSIRRNTAQYQIVINAAVQISVAALSALWSQVFVCASNRRINMALELAAATVHASPTFGGDPSEHNIIVPTNAVNADNHAIAFIRLPKIVHRTKSCLSPAFSVHVDVFHSAK